MEDLPAKHYEGDHDDSFPNFENPLDTENEYLMEATEASSSYLKQHKPSKRLLYSLITILLLSNFCLFALLITLQQANGRKFQVPWSPPEVSVDKTFNFQTIYGDPPSDQVEEAWNALMPVGRGFVLIKNTTTLPQLPGLNQSISEQHAMISVFHQLHCLYTTRKGYFKALAGNIDQVNPAHLSHCWDYLRQAIMCHSDTTLEWMQAPPFDHSSTGWGYQHTCRDFGTLFEWSEQNRWKRPGKMDGIGIQ